MAAAMLEDAPLFSAARIVSVFMIGLELNVSSFSSAMYCSTNSRCCCMLFKVIDRALARRQPDLPAATVRTASLRGDARVNS